MGSSGCGPLSAAAQVSVRASLTLSWKGASGMREFTAPILQIEELRRRKAS